ncbi:hypothetical protein BN1723_013868 [Verticillium longisporum]|uniref:Uncharacterized protein n=1 Tax=Verticillium longisporum TaxID=100787 RepID=A0A0G4LXC6_VERLO|nr:hypothetical protein BN1723_013868 [Verticillium longisporum]
MDDELTLSKTSTSTEQCMRRDKVYKARHAVTFVCVTASTNVVCLVVVGLFPEITYNSKP